MINRKAVFADETKLFKTPYEPQSGDTVTLKIRTLANDVLKVYAVINGIKRIMMMILSIGLSFPYVKINL